jgi:Fic family protein
MELPIFNDNLKSSGSWAALLGREQQSWKQLHSSLIEQRMRHDQIINIIEWSGEGIDEPRLLDSAQMVSAWASEPEPKFTLERLFKLHRVLIGASPDQDVLRKTEASPINSIHDPAPASIVPRMLENAFDWFSTDSFIELHPVERASVVYLRLLDLNPFPVANKTTALLAASFYTESAGFPPLIIFSDETTISRYSNALEAAFRMLTQPLVEFFAEMLRATMLIGHEDEQ